MSAPLETDYLVVGAGAMGLAFADEILHGSKKARVIMVDRRTKPGGHWNDAYRFVTLHQPALYYGVNSMRLGAGGRDLVSQAQILAYYELVLRSLDATGRFRFLPACELDPARAEGDRTLVRSLLAPGRVHEIRARKLVDATYMDVRVPATTPPSYPCEGGARVVPINGLATLPRPAARYVVLGGGKTGIDAVLHLLEHGTSPDAISWVIPRDAWLLNRDNIQPDRFADELLDQMKLILEAPDLDALLDTLESRQRLLRLDPHVRPERYRCATVTPGELDTLRRVEDVIRLGRVSRVDGAVLHLADGRRRFDEREDEILYVDCTADGLAPRPPRPIFEPQRITLQSISMCQQVMSAATIAALELREESDARKNAMLVPVPHPRLPGDYPWCLWRTTKNMEALGKRLLPWLLTRRLSSLSHLPWLDKLRFLVGALRMPPPPLERIESLVGDHATTPLD